MKGAIDLTTGQRRIVLELIERHLPDTDVWAYGSRVSWTSRPESDLDLVVFSGADQSDQVADLREAFEESDLPFRVDMLVWDELPKSFQEAIDDEHVDLLTPQGYPSVPIGEIAEIVGGGTPSTRDSTNFDGIVPWLTPRDLSRPHHPYVSRGARNLSRQGLTVSSASLVPKGAVLLSTRASVGYTAIAACPLATNQSCHSLVPSSRILSAYLYYWITANVPELQRHATGSTFLSLSGRVLKEIRIPLPPLSVQHRLTHVLEVLDDKIELNRRMIATLDSLLRALFDKWFVTCNPVHAKTKEHDAGLPMPIASSTSTWRTESLATIAHFRNGLPLQNYRPEGTAIKLPVVKIRELRHGNVSGAAWASADIPSEYVIVNGDVVFSWSGSLLVAIWGGGRGALNQHLFRVSSTTHPMWFVYHWLLYHLPAFRRIAADKTTTMGHIRRKHLALAMCHIPDDHTLRRADEIVAPMWQILVSLIVGVQQLATLRDALLSRLIGVPNAFISYCGHPVMNEDAGQERIGIRGPTVKDGDDWSCRKRGTNER